MKGGERNLNPHLCVGCGATQVHGTAEPFYVIVEDVDQEHILHYELFILKAKFSEDDHSLSFTIPIHDP